SVRPVELRPVFGRGVEPLEAVGLPADHGRIDFQFARKAALAPIGKHQGQKGNIIEWRPRTGERPKEASVPKTHTALNPCHRSLGNMDFQAMVSPTTKG